MSSASSPRADARRNRDRVLAAAATVFAERGTSASTEDVAREAGVGVATVFRHFPTKRDLIRALITTRLQTVAADARSALDAPDAGSSFVDFFARTVRASAGKLELADALTELGGSPDEATAPVSAEITDAIAALLERAQRIGAVRPDLTVANVFALLVGASRANSYAPASQPLEVILDGLRTTKADR